MLPYFQSGLRVLDSLYLYFQIKYYLIISTSDNGATYNEKTESDPISALWNVIPILCEFPELIDDTDGINLLPAMLGNTQTAHDHLHWVFPPWQPTNNTNGEMERHPEKHNGRKHDL